MVNESIVGKTQKGIGVRHTGEVFNNEGIGLTSKGILSFAKVCWNVTFWCVYFGI